MVKTEEKYWYQPIGISFFDFILSNEEKRDFMFINPNNLNPVHMTITKMETETITIRGEAIEAIRAELRMTGFLAPFWVGNYWFSPDSGIILQYKGDTGPGSADVHMELTNIEGELDLVTGFYK